MNITAEISLYALDAAFKDRVIDFIEDLRSEPGLEVLTNQVSTQLRGDFEAVTGALNRAMGRAMREAAAGRGPTVAFVVKYLSSDLPTSKAPSLDRELG